MSTSTTSRTPARKRNGARMPNASAARAATSGPSTNPPTSNDACRPRLAPTDAGSRVITILRIAGPTAPLPKPSSSRAMTNAQNSVAIALPSIASAAASTPPRIIERGASTVGLPGKEQLCTEAGREAGGDDQPELRPREPVAIAQVREQRVDGSVAERHRPGHEEVREQGVRSFAGHGGPSMARSGQGGVPVGERAPRVRVSRHHPHVEHPTVGEVPWQRHECPTQARATQCRSRRRARA